MRKLSWECATMATMAEICEGRQCYLVKAPLSPRHLQHLRYELPVASCSDNWSAQLKQSKLKRLISSPHPRDASSLITITKVYHGTFRWALAFYVFNQQKDQSLRISQSRMFFLQPEGRSQVVANQHEPVLLQIFGKFSMNFEWRTSGPIQNSSWWAKRTHQLHLLHFLCCRFLFITQSRHI